MRTRIKNTAYLSGVLILALAGDSALAEIRIISGRDSEGAQGLAAKEVARYLYLRTGSLPNRITQNGDIVLATKGEVSAANPAIRLAAKDLKPQQYLIRTTSDGKKKSWWIVGGDDAGTLYGAYRFCENLGIRFYLHGDVIPEARLAAIPEMDETGKPLFVNRGMNPWGAHAQGLDTWDTDEWKGLLSQMVKMRMNTLLIHAYSWEPSLWAGPPEDVAADGRVRSANSGPVRFFSTASGSSWGVKPKKTGNYSLGASQLFESDDWGPEVMAGYMPKATQAEDAVEVYNRTGDMYKDAFTFGRKMGMKFGMGHELDKVCGKTLDSYGATDISVNPNSESTPSNPLVEKVYEGIFTRLSRAHPTDFYMAFTHEGDMWRNYGRDRFNAYAKEWNTILAVYERMKPPFELAAGGWVLGPAFDRAAFDAILPKNVIMSEFNRAYNGCVDEAFTRVQGRGKWSIPWCEEDTIFQVPQLWAGRMRKDMADAYGYGCTGVLGLFWRKVHVSPVADALARACWEQKGWNPEAGRTRPKAPRSHFYTEGPLSLYCLNSGGYVPHSPTLDIGEKPIAGTDDPVLYRSCRYDLTGYRVKVPNGSYKVTLKFCETQNSKRVFDIFLQGQKEWEGLDVANEMRKLGGRFAACDIPFTGIAVDNGWLVIDLVPRAGVPFLCAIEVTEGKRVVRRINCGGNDYKDWQGDLKPQLPNTLFSRISNPLEFEPRGMPVDDLYADWAQANFGHAGIGAIFAGIDGQMPIFTTDFGKAVNYCRLSWPEVKDAYKFVDDLEHFESQISTPAARERFDCWLSYFKYGRAMLRLSCLQGELKFNVLDKAKALQDPAARRKLLTEQALPILIQITETIREGYGYLLDSVTDIGGMQTLIDVEGRNSLFGLDKTANEVAELLAEPLPASCSLPKEYGGKPRIIVPLARPVLQLGEPLRLKVIVLDKQPAVTAVLRWRPLGGGEYQSVPLRHLARSVYKAELPATPADFEYHIEVKTVGGKSLFWPVTAPEANQTVVVW